VIFFYREQFNNTIIQLAATCPGKNITFVFCTLSPEQLPMALAGCNRNNLKWELFLWEKPNLRGSAHAGGARQATCCEFILVAFRRGQVDSTTHSAFYSLIDLQSKSQEVRAFNTIFFLLV